MPVQISGGFGSSPTGSDPLNFHPKTAPYVQPKSKPKGNPLDFHPKHAPYVQQPLAKTTAPKPKAAPKPRPTSAPSNSGGGGGSAPKVAATATPKVAAVATPAADPEPVAPKPPDLSDWYLSDPTFQAAYASDQQTRDQALTDLATKRANYDTDFLNNAKNMGRSGYSIDDKGQVVAGQWDPTNALGAYGQGLTGINNDFGSRGLSDSSFYGDALTNFNTGMNNQWNDLNNSRTQFDTDNGANTGAGAAAGDAFTTSVAQAQADSAARLAAQYGIDPSTIKVTPYDPSTKK
jgi:hypothetical protein